MSKIKVLSEEVIMKIAAGEVVEGPYSVVKELVENSIDAGAKAIYVSVEKGGIDTIRVTDDGCGMTREDALLAFKRHATSKIEKEDDIFDIGTLGFRGEALPSISSIAKVTCVTRPEGSEVGSKVMAHVKVIDMEEVGCPVGTTLEVEDLFQSVPARRKYLKAPEKEFAKVLDVMTSKALSRPDIRFKLTHNGKVIFSSPPATDLIERVAAVYGLGISKEMIKVDWSDKGVTIAGYISKPHVTRSRNSTHVIVNGRDIVHRELNRCVIDGYGTLVPRGRHPIAVLLISIDPQRVDVNVHPAKTEVRFVEEIKISRSVVEAVRKALSLGELVPPVEIEDLNSLGIRGKKPSAIAKDPGPRAKGQLQATINLDTGDMEVASSLVIGQKAASRNDKTDTEGGETGHLGLPSSISIKGQAGDCYIIGETSDGLVIIDQHAAHEKVVFEDLKGQLGSGRVDSQQLLTPVTLELSAKEAEELEGMFDALEMLGFKVEPFGGRSAIVKRVPSVLGVTVEPGAVHDVIADLARESGSLDPGQWKSARTLAKIANRVIATMACHTSTRGGRSLDLMEMKNIVSLLYKAKEPFNCPHGRPTIIFLPFGNLEKRFGRRN